MLSIIIPVFNGEKTIGGLLDSIRGSSFNDYEVIVVDDCSLDATASIIKRYGLKNIFLPRQSGPAAARNKGAEEAQGETLVFLDADVQIAPDTLERIAKKFQEDPQVKALVGTYDETPLNKGFFPRFKALWFISLFNPKDIYTDSLEGFCAAIDRKAFFEAGGFNPFFTTSSAEDYELGCRLRQEYKLHFDANIKIRHNFPGFIKNAACFFRRTRDFMPFFLKQDKAGRGSTFNRDGLACLFALLSLLALPFAFYGYRLSAILFSFLFLGFILAGLKFIALVFTKEGLFFGITSIITYYINSIIIGLAIILGTLRYLLRLR